MSTESSGTSQEGGLHSVVRRHFAIEGDIEHLIKTQGIAWVLDHLYSAAVNNGMTAADSGDMVLFQKWEKLEAALVKATVLAREVEEKE